jgi:hypothetical protein
MDRENYSRTLFWPEWESIPIPSHQQSERQLIAPQDQMFVTILQTLPFRSWMHASQDHIISEFGNLDIPLRAICLQKISNNKTRNNEAVIVLGEKVN